MSADRQDELVDELRGLIARTENDLAIIDHRLYAGY